MSEFRSCDSDHFDFLFIFLSLMLEALLYVLYSYCKAHAATGCC